MWLIASFGFDVCVNVVHSFDKYNFKWHSIRSSWILIYFILECFVFCLTAAVEARNIARPNDSSSHRKLVWKAQLSKYKQFSWNLNIIIILFYSGDNGVWNAIELNRENTRNENIYSLLYANVKLFHKINTSPFHRSFLPKTIFMDWQTNRFPRHFIMPPRCYIQKINIHTHNTVTQMNVKS